MTVVGVVSLQGDFAEHAHMLGRCGADVVQVRRSCELEHLDGLIIPGGESTTIAKLTGENDDPIFGAIRERAFAGMPIYGTCMGSIFLAKEIEGSSQGRLALMDIQVRRNAFGPQRFSFEEYICIPSIGTEPFLAVFIRAPMILSCAANVEVLARIDAGIVMARQQNLFVSTFHPEISGDERVHEYFLCMVDRWRSTKKKSVVQSKRSLAVTSGAISAIGP